MTRLLVLLLLIGVCATPCAGQEDFPDDVFPLSPPPANDTWVRIAIVAGLAALAWLAFRPRVDFTIRVSPRGIRFQGMIPRAAQGAIGLFFQQEFPPEQCFRVSGRWTGERRKGTRRLHFLFHGPISAGEQQRIRNFLLTVL